MKYKITLRVEDTDFISRNFDKYISDEQKGRDAVKLGKGLAETLDKIGKDHGGFHFEFDHAEIMEDWND